MRGLIPRTRAQRGCVKKKQAATAPPRYFHSMHSILPCEQKTRHFCVTVDLSRSRKRHQHEGQQGKRLSRWMHSVSDFDTCRGLHKSINEKKKGSRVSDRCQVIESASKSAVGLYSIYSLLKDSTRYIIKRRNCMQMQQRGCMQRSALKLRVL